MRVAKFLITDMYLVSDNRRLMPGRGRFIANGAYRKYKEDLTTLFRIQLPLDWQPLEGPFSVRVRVWTHKDQSNLIKAVLDALQGAGVIRDDKYCHRLFMIKTPQPRTAPERMTVEVSERTSQNKSKGAHIEKITGQDEK